MSPVDVTPTPTAGERDRAAHRQRRLARYDEVTALQAQGHGIATIAKRLGMARKTVRRFLRADGFPERVERSGPSGRLASFEAYLQQRWEEGCRNASQLFREIKAQGYPGSASYVGQALGSWRTAAAPTGRRRAGSALPHGSLRSAAPRPRRADRTPRQVRFLLLRPVTDLNKPDQTYRDALLGACPVVQAAQQLVAEFQRVVKTHDIGALASWLTAAQTSDVPELQGFALGVRQDRARPLRVSGKPGSPSPGVKARPKDRSIVSRKSNERCTGGLTSICSACGYCIPPDALQLAHQKCRRTHYQA